MARKKRDPAEQIGDNFTIPDSGPAREKTPAAKPPKVTIKACQGIVEAIQSVALLIGHAPEDAQAERDAAVAGLMAAARHSVLVARLITGTQFAGDYGTIALGVGGLVGRIGLDLAATVRPEETVKVARERVYAVTGVGYTLMGAAGGDLSGLFGGPPVPETEPDIVEAGGTYSPDRSNGVGQDILSPILAPIQETSRNVPHKA